MKKILSIMITVAMMFAVVPTSYADNKNLMNNPSFEKAISGWESSNATIEKNDEFAHSGSSSAKVSVLSMYGSASYYYNFKKGVEYNVSVWIRMEQGLGQHRARFIFSYDTGSPQWQELATDTIVTDDGWVQMSTPVIYNGTNKTGAGNFNVRIDGGTEPTTFYMDDVSITTNVEQKYRETEYADGEMVENRGFDDNAEGWIENGATITRVEGEGYNNSAASGFINATDNGYVAKKLYLEQGKKYDLSTFVKTDGNGAFFNLVVKHEDGTSDKVAFLNTSDGSWNIIKGEYLQNKESEYVSVYVTSNNTDRFYIDEMSCIAKNGIFDIKTNTNVFSELTVLIDNKKTDIHLSKNGEYILCSLAELASVIGGQYSSDGKKAEISRGTNTVSVYNNTMISEKNGKLCRMNTRASVDTDAAYAEINYIASSLGCSINISNNAVYISTTDKIQLNNSANCLKNNKKLNICFLTGSEPQRSGTFDPYTTPVKTLLKEWFKRNYNDCTVNIYEEDNSASGVALGAFRVSNIVEKNDVDLLFVDLFRNDINKQAADVDKYLESIIRNAKAKKPDIDIVLLKTLNEKYAEMLANNSEPQISEAYERIAKIYNIPIISNGRDLYKLYVSEGKSYDAYHNKTKNPNSAGSTVYAELLIEKIKEGLGNADNTINTMNRSMTDSFKGRIVPASTFDIKVGWKYSEESLSGCDVSGFVESNTADSEITSEISGNVIGLYYQSAPDSGDIFYSIDNGEYKMLSTFDEYAYKFEHMVGTVLADNLPSGKHILKIKVANSKNKNSMNNFIRVGGILVGENDN